MSKIGKYKPPRWAAWLLYLLSRQTDQYSLMDDLEIEYSDLAAERGRVFASVWYMLHALRAAPEMIFFALYWRMTMLKNYFTVALRNILKYKLHAFINITGLAVGMACCILIMLWVQDELSYDRFHVKGDRICRVIQQEHTQNKKAITPAPYGPALKDNFKEIVEYARIGRPGRTLCQYEDKTFYERNIWYVDPSFLTMFTFPLIRGNTETALSDPYGMVVSEEMAEKYFGNEDPIGKTVTLKESFNVMITAVMKKVPQNSHLQFDFLGRFELCEKEYGWGIGWGNNNYTTYIQLAEGAASEEVGSKIEGFVKTHRPEANTRLFLQHLKDIYLRSDFDYDFTGSGGFRSTYVAIFSMIALFVLVIACINFMNLSTARSGKRGTEVGIRKVSGADRRQLVRQFLSESVAMSLLALGVALFIVTMVLPAFNRLADREITMMSSWSWIGLLGLGIITLITGVVAGSYPALLLSSFQPAIVLKGAQRSGVKASGFRKILVVLQFSLSVFLIIGTLTVYKQLGHIRKWNLGYDKDHILITRLLGEIRDRVEAVKTELLKSPYIQGVAASSDITTYTYHSTSGNAVWWEGKQPDENILMYHYDIDDDFIQMMGMEIVEGRNFSDAFSLDASSSYIVNETAVRAMNMEDPIGKRFALWGRDREGTIIGVVKDFHFQSLREEIAPFIFRIRPEGYRYLVSRIRSQDAAAAVKVLEAVCKRFNPEHPFDYFFMEEAFDSLYRSEERMGTIMTVFAGLAVFISCLGLFGLTSFMMEQRRKEIGIRKVLGASIPEVVRLFSKEFIFLVVLANVFAWPAAYFALNQWLQGFAYRMPLGIGIFLISTLLSLVLALATVSYQSIMAALANPVESLKYE